MKTQNGLEMGLAGWLGVVWMVACRAGVRLDWPGINSAWSGRLFSPRPLRTCTGLALKRFMPVVRTAFAGLFLMATGAGLVWAQAPQSLSAARIEVDAGEVLHRVSPFLTGSCIEDVNHEI